MKRLPLRLILLSGILTLLFASNAYTQQNPVQCWDFEENCLTPENAFHAGCIANAQSASGTPDTYSNFAGIGAFSGSKYAHMYAKYCFIEPSNPNRNHTEGVILKHKFLAGVPVEISFAIRSKGGLAPSETKVVLVNSMPNYGGIGGTPGCLNTLDLLPNIPANSETMATYSNADISGSAWETKTITWTPQANFNQIWFRPKAISQAINGEVSQDLLLDNVCIIDHCPPPPSISYCLYPGTGQVLVNINGFVNPHAWSLSFSPDCLPTFGPYVKIQWLPDYSGFVLAQNSGCYTLISNSIPAPWCPSKENLFMINTNGNLPLCTDLCPDWEMTITHECDHVFEVIPSTPFSTPTTISFALNNTTMQSGSNTSLTIPVNHHILPNGWHEMCVTVQQPNCPQWMKCYAFYSDCFRFGGDSNERTEKTNGNKAGNSISFSNPSSGTIWISTPIEQGIARLYSMQGAIVKSFVLDETDQLNVSELITGQYILSIQSPGLSVSKPVFIQNQR